MAIYKRGKVYWYKFEFMGKPYQASTRLRNERKAAAFEAKLKSDLALGRVGLAVLRPAPPLTKYAEQFRAFIRTRNKEHPETISFYEEKLDRLLEYKRMADAQLNQIDEDLIEEYVQWRSKKVAPASVNRELATLRRALRVAWKTHKLITGVPSITMLPGEGERDFVLSYDQEKAYLTVAEDPLRDFAILSLDTGVRAGEGVSLEWNEVSFQPAVNARLGYIEIRKGKSRNAKRILSMTKRVRAMLENRRRFHPKHRFVFPGRRKDSHILVSSLDHQHVTARDAAKLEDGSGLPGVFVIHCLRHTFGTRLGETGANTFTIMKAMGHSSSKVSEKYVHPTPDFMERAFERLDSMNQIMRGEKEAEERLGVVTISGTLPVDGAKTVVD